MARTPSHIINNIWKKKGKITLNVSSEDIYIYISVKNK
jgi:hypothetical protein